MLSNVEIIVLLTLLSVILFVVGVPVLLVFSNWAIGFSLFASRLPVQNIAIVPYEQLNSFPFAAIPLFITLGALINEFGISRDIINFTRSFAGRLPGSTANTALYTCAVFSAITGSNSATTASVGKALQPELEKENYDPDFAAATIASGGTLGIIIPPSVLFILYGITFSVSVTDLFLAGLVPGLFMLGGLSVVSSYLSYSRGYGRESETTSLVNVIRSAWDANVAIFAIVILLGGIYAGFFTPAESASVALAYLLVAGAVGKQIKSVGQLWNVLLSAVVLTGVIIPVFITSAMVQQGLSYLGLQDVIANAVIGLQHPILIGLGMVLIMLFTGSVLASVPNMIITAPLLAPAAAHLGLSPIMWGVIFMISDAIGFITPPYGLNLYIISGITDLDYTTVARAALPYLATLTAVWIFFFAFPGANPFP
jgi:C4-dicarboxylate transporter DctM subunit